MVSPAIVGESATVASWWDPIDVSAWEDYAPESRGPRRPKMWLKDPDGEVWLRKSPPPPQPPPARQHTARRSEPAIEAFALELARRAGLDVARTRPAVWSVDGASTARGIVSKRFHAADEEHHPGSELLGLSAESGSSPDAKRRRDEGRASATLERVRSELETLEAAHNIALLAPFTRVLAFDAWLGNGDRHSGNWALITGPRGARLAPMYDPTACLGVELTDDRVELVAPTAYVDRCPSGFGGGDDGRTGIRMSEVLAKLVTWPEWGLASSELAPRFKALTADVVPLLAEIPDEWLSPARKTFATHVLGLRVRLFDEG